MANFPLDFGDGLLIDSICLKAAFFAGAQGGVGGPEFSAMKNG